MYTVSDTITATLTSDGTLTFSGTGVIPDYSASPSKRPPWTKQEVNKVVIENGITGLGKYFLYACTGITTIDLAASVTNIPAYAFSGVWHSSPAEIYCRNEGELTLSSSNQAFLNCTNTGSEYEITVYVYNEAVKSVWEEMLSDSAASTYTLVNVVLAEPAPTIVSEYTVSDTITATLTSDGTLTFSGTGEIPDYGASPKKRPPWNGNLDIKRVVFEDGITSIGKYIIRQCDNVAVIDIAASVTNISESAFGSATPPYPVEIYFRGENITVSTISQATFGNQYGTTVYVYNDVAKGIWEEVALEYAEYDFKVVLASEDPTDPTTPSLDYTALDQAISDGEAVDTSKYTEASVKTLTDAISAGKAVKENSSATQTDVDNAAQAIKAAIDGLVEQITVVAAYDISANGDGSVTATLSSDGTFVISGTGASKDYNFQASSSHTPWNTDGNYTKIKSVIIESGVTSLGSSLLSQLPNMESVSIPDTVTSVGSYCFGTDSSAYQNKLTSIVIPESVTEIGAYAFSYSTSLVSVTLPSGLTSIPNYLFRNCTALTTVNIPDTVTGIGSNAFYSCSSLASVTLNDSITSIGERAFQGCSSLTSINIPSSLTALGARAFRDCNLTGKVVIPEGITVLDSNIFRANPSTDLEIYVMGAITKVGTAPFSEGAGKIYVYDGNTYNLISGTDHGTFEIIYDGEVDTSELEAVIAQAEALNESDYTASTWSAVASALEAAKAELANEDKTSTSVIAATTALNNAINSLVKEGKYMSYIYKNGAQANIISCKVTNDMAGAAKIKVNFDCASDTSYNPNAAIDFLINNDWNNNYEFKGTYSYDNGTTGCSETIELTSALVKGKDLTLTGYTYSWGGASDYVYAVTSVDFLDADGNVIYTVTSDTVILDTTALESAIAKGEAVDAAKYTADSYAVLTSAIGTAKTVLENADTTQEDIDAAAKAITDAIAGLELKVVTGTVTGTIKVSDKDDSTEITVTATSSDGKETVVTATSMGTYTIENLEVGDYTLEISGGKYATRTYEITVAEGNNTQNVELNPYGDINGDGDVTTADVGMANSHAKGVIILTDYAFVCANVSDKAGTEVTTADVGMINSHAKGVKALW